MGDEKSEADASREKFGQKLFLSESANRFWKYAFLLLALVINITLVYGGFSHYLARRSLDAELETRKISSLEYLGVLAKRERAIVVDTLETRCAERVVLAMYRTLDAKTQLQIDEAYRVSMDLRDGLVVLLQEALNNPKDEKQKKYRDLIDLKQLVEDVKKYTYSFAKMRVDRMVKPAGETKSDNPEFKTAVNDLIDWLQNEPQLKGQFEKLAHYEEMASSLREKFNKEGPYFKDVGVLEARLKRLGEARKKNADTLGGTYDDILSKYAVWTQASMAQKEQNPILDDAAFELSRDNEKRLAELDCERFTEYLKRLSIDTAETPGPVWRFYQARLQGFFESPPIAQTLFVTLILGALGALATNTLRLSNFGWWGAQPDPLWGELLLAPFIGALAAFGVFLLGSTGLLFTAEVKSGGATTTLSPFFIGMLGFISGLVYDDAFLRVRGIAKRLFAGDGTISGATPEDAALAETLRAAKASYVADLVLKFGIGKRLAGEKEFTFFVPSDDAMLLLPMQVWKDISNAEARSKFENWFRRHHAVKRVKSSDVPNNGTEIQVEDEQKFALVKDADGTLTVEKIKVAQSDITWINGVIHILSQDLPEKAAAPPAGPAAPPAGPAAPPAGPAVPPAGPAPVIP
jgi:uncharacterized surface protein with fasciclin (FAS1) repeats